MSHRPLLAPVAGPSSRPRTAASKPTDSLYTIPSNDAEEDTIEISRSNNRIKGTTTDKRRRSRTTPRAAGNSTQDFQAQADAIEQIQDEEDPDFVDSHQESFEPRKRKHSDVVPAIARKERRKSKPHHRSYSGCGPAVQGKRDKFFDTIVDNWGEHVEAWLPVDLIPTQTVGVDRGESVMERLELVNWNTRLLEQLSRLAASMPRQPRRAYRALELAAKRDNRPKHIYEIMKEDVELAVSRVEQTTASASSAIVLDGAASPASTRWTTDEAAPNDVLDEDIPAGDHSTMISPRLAAVDETIVRPEGRLTDQEAVSGRFDDQDDLQNVRSVSELDICRAHVRAAEAKLEYVSLKLQALEHRQLLQV